MCERELEEGFSRLCVAVMPSSSALSSLAGKLCKATPPSLLPLSYTPCRCFSLKAKSSKVDREVEAKAKAKKPQPAMASPPKPRKPNVKPMASPPKPKGAVQVVYRISSTLAPVLQTSETTRSDALKRIWDYIKAHNLQSSTEKSQIVCDSALKKAFGRDNMSVLEVLKYLSPHLSRKI